MRRTVLVVGAVAFGIAFGAGEDPRDSEIVALKSQIRLLKASRDYTEALLSVVRNDVTNCLAELSKEKDAAQGKP